MSNIKIFTRRAANDDKPLPPGYSTAEALGTIIANSERELAQESAKRLINERCKRGISHPIRNLQPSQPFDPEV